MFYIPLILNRAASRILKPHFGPCATVCQPSDLQYSRCQQVRSTFTLVAVEARSTRAVVCSWVGEFTNLIPGTISVFTQIWKRRTVDRGETFINDFFKIYFYCCWFYLFGFLYRLNYCEAPSVLRKECMILVIYKVNKWLQMTTSLYWLFR